MISLGKLCKGSDYPLGGDNASITQTPSRPLSKHTLVKNNPGSIRFSRYLERHRPQPRHHQARAHHRRHRRLYPQVFADVFLPVFSFFPDLSAVFRTSSLVLPKRYPCSAQLPNKTLHKNRQISIDCHGQPSKNQSGKAILLSVLY